MDVEGFDTRYLDESKQKDTVLPRFYVRSVRDEAETKRSGQVVFTDKEFVEIRVPGDKLNVIDCPVSETHKRRWPQWYKAFAEKREMKPAGFHLAAWPLGTPALVSTLAQINCHTVEQLANLPETSLPRFQGMLKIQEQAREFLKSREDASVVNRLQNEKQAMQDKIALQEDAIAELKARLLALESSQPAPEVKRRPGRPRKDET